MSKKLFGALFFFSALAQSQPAQIKGWAQIDQMIIRRVLKNGYSSFVKTKVSSELLGLLGQPVSSSDLEAGFESGEPNAVNFTLWSMVFQELAIQMADTCNNAPNAQKWFREEVFQALNQLCAPSAELGLGEKRIKELEKLWDLQTYFEVPESHRERWLANLRAQAPSGAALDAAQVKHLIKTAILTLWLDPYILSEPSRHRGGSP